MIAPFQIVHHFTKGAICPQVPTLTQIPTMQVPSLTWVPTLVRNNLRPYRYIAVDRDGTQAKRAPAEFGFSFLSALTHVTH